MLLVNTIRDNFENTLAGLQKRNFQNAQDVLIQVLDLDNKRKETQSQRDSLQAESNNYSKEIGILMREGKKEEAEKIKAFTSEIKEKVKSLEDIFSQTEEELKAAGRAYKAGSFPIKALGRARASMDTSGFVKILADAETDEILGVHMIAPRAADLIMEAVTAMEYRASAEDIARICHGHPTYSEAVKEAALAATADRALHI